MLFMEKSTINSIWLNALPVFGHVAERERVMNSVLIDLTEKYVTKKFDKFDKRAVHF